MSDHKLPAYWNAGKPAPIEGAPQSEGVVDDGESGDDGEGGESGESGEGRLQDSHTLPGPDRPGSARMGWMVTNGLMPDGTNSRPEARVTLLAKLSEANDRLRETWAQTDIEDVHVKGLVVRMKAGQRWAHQLYAKYRLANGDTGPLTEKIARALGTSLDIARSAIEVHRAASAAAADPAILREQAEQHLARVYTESPALAYRSPLRKVLLDLDAGQGLPVLDGATQHADLRDAADGAEEGPPGGGS